MNLTILYRGPLSSCNFACSYCPFSKRQETIDDLATDRAALLRLVDWLGAREGDPASVFFTPWGEALTRPWYRDAIVDLTRMANVERVAVQTNLSGPIRWVARADPAKLGVWATWHPRQLTLDQFSERVHELAARGIRVSAGVVGIKQHLDDIALLRKKLSPAVYVWVNAFRHVPGYYSPTDIDALELIDPLFRVNLASYPSLGHPCHCGHTVVSVDGSGNVKPCHVSAHSLGNLYDDTFKPASTGLTCSTVSCGCHIGYVHMPELGMHEVFGDGILERVPAPRWSHLELRQLAMHIHARAIPRQPADPGSERL